METLVEYYIAFVTASQKMNKLQTHKDRQLSLFKTAVIELCSLAVKLSRNLCYVYIMDTFIRTPNLGRYSLLISTMIPSCLVAQKATIYVTGEW